MKISIDEVMDFVACPALYSFKHRQNLAPPQHGKGRPSKNSILDLYDEALHKAIAYLFDSVSGGFYPSVSNLAKKWGYLWVKPRSEQEDIRFKQSSWRDTHEKKRVQGWGKLQAVRAFYEANPGTPFMVDYPYEVPMGRHTLTGRIDLVRAVKNDKGREEIIMTEFLTDERNTPYVNLKRDWRVTASSYAFRKIMNVTEEKIVYHGIISGRQTDTRRGTDDFAHLSHLLDVIEHMSQHHFFYPVFNERCITCPYQKYCEKGWFDAKNQK